ncbi:AraC family transcriptional regulator [Mucilaginibacter phyllosphaerae]|uniref:AraC family transcriptional regulator n=1 Tax=Mucilaginibacter phyllosphaerae TaxID=1812349 RepID=A0A4Y8AFL1_9SPHI|nr:AraC family transcriptional regulator [Mucilaginibacter phyllosphaerae]MBB3968799.1 AraC-like DNA-binding protein [Mucilaginibacter phyllosphaerae]TEW67566.1 AraC family transcriptional regulator [Mucilaginibacter phyllosphaerae]GGH13809.1 hypothetical protein GCM10007352_21520 [Mucilaginibacter phyllosphaerae]
MKVLPFTIPVPPGKTIIVQQEVLPHFYPHLHRHAEVQITWIKKGEGTLLAGNSMHPFSAGDIFIMGANLPHLFKSGPEYFEDNSQLTSEALTVFFDPAGELAAMFNLLEMGLVKSFFNQGQAGFKIPLSLSAAFIRYIAQIQHSTGALQIATFVEMLGAMAALEDMQQLSAANFVQHMTDPEGMRIASVYNYIMHNYGSTLTLDDVARQAHLTPNAFCRYFKKHTRVTFTAFVNKVRVGHACKLLANGDLNSIADVAYSCGFSSITNFNYVFKNIVGKAPRDYLNDYTGTVKVNN